VPALQDTLCHAGKRHLDARKRQEPQRNVVARGLPIANRMSVAPIRERRLEGETFAFRDLLPNPLEHKSRGTIATRSGCSGNDSAAIMSAFKNVGQFASVVRNSRANVVLSSSLDQGLRVQGRLRRWQRLHDPSASVRGDRHHKLVDDRQLPLRDGVAKKEGALTFEVSPDSITFHLFEAVATPTS
jgi:hypothetical protein